MKERIQKSIKTLKENLILHRLVQRFLAAILITFVSIIFNTYILKFDYKIIEYIVIIGLTIVYTTNVVKIKKRGAEIAILVTFYFVFGIRASNYIENISILNITSKFIYGLLTFLLVCVLATETKKYRRYIHAAFATILMTLISGNIFVNAAYVIFVFGELEDVLYKEDENKEQASLQKCLDSPFLIYLWFMIMIQSL